MPTRKNGMLTAPIIIVASLSIVLMAFSALHDIVRRPTSDFSAFYCGALVSLAHRDPYALSSLWTCEASTRVGGAVAAQVGIDPDPLPGYDMAFFAPLTMLPYRDAELVWDAVLVAAVVATAAILSSLTDLPFVVVGAILAFTDGALILHYGQLAPVLLFGLTLAAYGLVRERPFLTFVGVGLSMIEPHIALAAYCAIFVWRPSLRLGLIGVAAVLAGLSILTLGVLVNIEYVRAALPTQAQAEATTALQYSLSWLLHYAGVADAQAIRIASVQYAVFAVASVLLAGPIARKLDSPAAIPLFPAMISLIGGPYLHLNQMAAAIPFALLLVTRLQGLAAATTWIAIALLAVPWAAGSRLTTLEASTIVITLALAALRNQRAVVIASATIVSALLYAALTGPVMTQLVPAMPRHAMSQSPVMPRALDGDQLASEEDARESRRDNDYAISTPRTLAQKLPIWLALCALAIVAVTRKTTSAIGSSQRDISA